MGRTAVRRACGGQAAERRRKFARSMLPELPLVDAPSKGERPMKILTAFLTLALASPAFALIKTETVEYKDGDTSLEGLVAYDDAKEGARPGVLVIHDWTGLFW